MLRALSTLTGFVNDRNKAEEIASRAFQKAWDKRETFRGEASPSTWIESIARREAQHSWVNERTHPVESIDRFDARDVVAAELVTDEVERREDLFRLHGALDKVADKYRRALVAHFVEGLSIRQIAHREGVPLGTVLSRIHHGKQQLRIAWDAASRGLNHNVPSAASLSSKPVDKQESPSRQRSEGPSPEPMAWDR